MVAAGQISHLLSLAHVDSLSIPYMALVFWHLLTIELSPQVHFIGPLCAYTFGFQINAVTVQVTESGTDPPVEAFV